jgi:hypothetical protein
MMIYIYEGLNFQSVPCIYLLVQVTGVQYDYCTDTCSIYSIYIYIYMYSTHIHTNRLYT